jgi:CrcB protein
MTPEMTPLLALAVAVGGALGALVRYGAQIQWPARGARVPVAVLLVNVFGSAVGGTFLAVAQWDATSSSPVIPAALILIVMTGFCGGLTTFSTFAVETVELATSGSWRPAVLNIVLNLVLGVAAAALAFALTNGALIATSGAFVG